MRLNVVWLDLARWKQDAVSFDPRLFSRARSRRTEKTRLFIAKRPSSGRKALPFSPLWWRQRRRKLRVRRVFFARPWTFRSSAFCCFLENMWPRQAARVCARVLVLKTHYLCCVTLLLLERCFCVIARRVTLGPQTSCSASADGLFAQLAFNCFCDARRVLRDILFAKSKRIATIHPTARCQNTLQTASART